jgi:small subunit ribosomal protein S12
MIFTIRRTASRPWCYPWKSTELCKRISISSATVFPIAKLSDVVDLDVSVNHAYICYSQISDQTRQVCKLAMPRRDFSKLLTGFFRPKDSLLLGHTSVSVEQPACGMASLMQMHKKGPPKRKLKGRMHPLEGNPQLKGVVLKTLIKKPKKPNSANRKCVRVKLSNGKEVTAYIPGEGHNLQEHNVVLVRGGRMQDLPGVKLKCIRGKYDLAHVRKDK